jgi:hypothetical protein
MNNDFVMNQTHHEFEHLLQDTAESVSEGAPPVAYSGYEKFSGQFFSYRRWNKSEFDVSARQRDDYEQIPTGSNLNDKVSSNAEPQLLPQLREPPQVALCINIEINCPLEVAPIEYLEKIR